jgi:hypothetical protein
MIFHDAGTQGRQRMLTFKFNFEPSPVRTHYHCYGWDYLIHKLSKILPQSEAGIVIDDFVESFFWDASKKPHLSPWIGISHFTPTAPEHLHTKTLNDLLQLPKFTESLPHCKLIIVLSSNTKKFFQDRINIPINIVHHPKELPVRFALDSYLKFPMLFHAGFYLRNFAKYYELNTKIARSFHISILRHIKHLQSDLEFYNIPMNEFRKRIHVYDRFLSDEEYLALLTNQISFCWLYDSSANNSILESIASRSPIVVNRLPATVEYLGDNYPLYYENIRYDPNERLLDRKLLSETIDYLEHRSHLFHVDNFCRFFLGLQPSDLA